MLDITALLATNYAIAGVDPTFATGRRAQWSYALRSSCVGFAKLNPGGPDPGDYIRYARAELLTSSAQAPINAIGHAKRAVHQAVDGIFFLHGLRPAFGNLDFPGKLALLTEIGAFPTALIAWLNDRRNLVEHAYSVPSADEVVRAVEIAELFIVLSYTFLKSAVVGAYVGYANGPSCSELLLDPAKAIITDTDIEVSTSVDIRGTRVHVNIPEHAPRNPVRSIPISRANKADWLPILDLFTYCSRMQALQLHLVGPPGVHCTSRVKITYPPGTGLPQPSPGPSSA
jgi:hypothetical protein